MIGYNLLIYKQLCADIGLPDDKKYLGIIGLHEALATIDEQLQLLVSSALHKVPWLHGRDEVKCAVEILGFGAVRVRPLERWAGDHAAAASDATATLEADEDEKWETRQFPLTYVATAKRKVPADKSKPGQGPSLHELTLPALAALALFTQGTGPLLPRRGGHRKSGTVVLRTHADIIELLGQPLLGTPSES